MIFSELITYLHLIGFALGFGGAMVSDALFFSSIKDNYLSQTEFRFMQLASRLVWLGVLLLFVSGVVLVYVKPELLSSSKFLTKVAVVGVIIVNGLIFHKIHLPYLRAHLNISLYTSVSFLKRSHLLVMSGAISVVSWFTAALLGSLPGLPYEVGTLLSIYGLLLVVAILGGIGMNYILFRRAR